MGETAVLNFEELIIARRNFFGAIVGFDAPLITGRIFPEANRSRARETREN